MKQNLEQLLEIEYNLQSKVSRMVLVFQNSKDTYFWHQKIQEFFESMKEEVLDLNISSYSTAKIKQWMEELEEDFGVFSFTSFIYQEMDDYTCVPEHRLYNHLKNEYLKRINPSYFKGTIQRINYYYSIFEARLLKAFFDTAHHYKEYMDYSFLPIFYYVMYMFPGLENPFLYDEFHLDYWISNQKEYEVIEKEFILPILKEYLETIHECPMESLLVDFSYPDFKILFQTIIDFAGNYFTKEEINDKIDEILKEENKKEFVNEFLNSHRNNLRILERKE